MKFVQNKRSAFLTLSLPSFIFGFGFLLFYSQLLLKWWSPASMGALLLSALAILSTLTLTVGALVGLVEFSKRALIETGSDKLERYGAYAMLAALFGVLAVGAFSASKPTHLIQETDFLNYHLLLPKQHWITASWSPVEWSIFEFRLLAIQYALSFLWIGLPLLNKLPQFLMLVFLLLRIWFLFDLVGTRRPYLAGVGAAVALLAFRGIGIQVGMAMLDLPTLYYLAGIALAVAYARSDQRPGASHRLVWFVAGLDLAAYLGHKSFAFAFLGALVVFVELSLILFFKTGVARVLLRANWLVLLAPVFMFWVPNLARSFFYTGDPLFPLAGPLGKAFCSDARLESVSCADLELLSAYLVSIVGDYGYGHGAAHYLKTFFLVPLAVDGNSRVNNIFDYPLGMIWYLAWGLLAAGLITRAFRRESAFFATVGLGFFTLWFMGSQQSRWLYPVLVLLALGLGYWLSSERKPRWLAGLTVAALVMASSVNAARTIRSQRATLGCFGVECLHSDSKLISDYENKCEKEPVFLQDTNSRAYLSCRVSAAGFGNELRGK